MNDNKVKSGIILGIIAYILWGFLPIYWKLLDNVPSGAVLAHRIVWSFVFMVLYILFTKRWTLFIQQCKDIFFNAKVLLAITAASIVISLNWLTFIWAVQHDYVVQASLGYYINPLLSVLLGMIFLQEKLSKAQFLSFLLASIGVAYLTIDYGTFPWVSFALAISFATYGLFKKVANVSAVFSLAIETLLVTPLALGYLIFTFGIGIGFGDATITKDILLLFSGVATAIPLLLFGMSVINIPLSMVGFLQYIAPTIMLIIGVFFYGEPFTTAHIITFSLIWISLFIYMSASIRERKKKSTSH